MYLWQKRSGIVSQKCIDNHCDTCLHVLLIRRALDPTTLVFTGGFYDLMLLEYTRADTVFSPLSVLESNVIVFS